MTTPQAVAATGLQQAYSELAFEHKSILALVKRAQDTKDIPTLVPLLDELHDLLMNHFAHEQYPGGFYDSMGATGSKKHQQQLEELLEDHNYMLATLREVLDRAHGRAAHNDEGLLQEVGAVIERLHQHERKEHALAEALLQSEPT